MDSNELRSFFDAFLKPPANYPGQSPKALIEHWVTVYNHPERFSEDNNPRTLAKKRRNARQNLRRLLRKHPRIAESYRQEHLQYGAVSK
jgi:hypothetical protein